MPRAWPTGEQACPYIARNEYTPPADPLILLELLRRVQCHQVDFPSESAPVALGRHRSLARIDPAEH